MRLEEAFKSDRRHAEKCSRVPFIKLDKAMICKDVSDIFISSFSSNKAYHVPGIPLNPY